MDRDTTVGADTAAEQHQQEDQRDFGKPADGVAVFEAASTHEDHLDVDVDVDDSSNRLLRRPKRRSCPSTSPGCPVCGVTLRAQELQQHWQVEVERLQGIARSVAKRQRGEASSGGGGGPRWESLRKVRANRRSRNGASGRGVHCPVCHQALQGSPDQLAEHVDRCLARGGGDDEDESVDAEGSFDEYEWAGQSRLRATALLEGGFRAAGWVTSGGSSSSVSRRDAADEDDDQEDLDVDGDDCDTFGQAQYTEADLIPLESDEPAEERDRQRLRQALISPNQRGSGSTVEETRRDTTENDTSTSSEETQPGDGGGALSQVVMSLRERVRQLEQQHQSANLTKCLICMEPYTVPVVSVCCWHVHCQDCWLKTLGAKKLCPQCNSITAAADLRRIYL
ncbi:E3 ubiquitin-protein ligase RNF220 isoform X1 [Ixodes scapularis]|uniref:E3 ubiquitin-protein ligase RNF220 isoform X2 n=1 Tax=Ixodes scapularis TaxID=6945 RepID=UPI001C393CD2|nr:E3 ubiquitin-protein ligase RNF220 isoform X2 [Ixodes scapularis]XP_042145305.1 E3 ubiquitin-protein ligase RNF220 isoform X1 [Ixodes scapularis]